MPNPENKVVNAVNAIIDGLLLGLGEDVIIYSAKAQLPFLGLPVIAWIFKNIISFLITAFDTAIKKHIDNVVIRLQGDISKHAFDQVMERFKSGGQSGKDLDDAKKAIDGIVHRTQ